MNRRILYIAFDVVPSPKGASTHILHFLRGLVNGGYQVNLITPGDGSLPEVDEVEGAQVMRIPPSDGGTFLERAIAFGHAVLAHLESAERYDFVHYRSVWGGLQAAELKNRYGYKTLFEVNGLPSVELKYHYPGLRESGLLDKIREQERATLMLSDWLVCPADVTRAFLVSLGVDRQRITVIPNGVSPNDFPETPLPADDGHIPEILYIGTLADWQGLDIAIKAVPFILEEHPVKLRIVGRGRSRQRKALAKQVRKLGLADNINIDPPQPHHTISDVIELADICVAPLTMNDRNITQGCCPIKVIEYMASGRPLVAANLPVVRELVREDIDGLLFDPGDPEDLARQVVALLRDRQLAQRLASNGAQVAREKFTWHIAQKSLLKVYTRLSGD